MPKDYNRHGADTIRQLMAERVKTYELIYFLIDLIMENNGVRKYEVAQVGRGYLRRD